MDLAAYLAKRKIKAAVFAAEIGVPPSTITRILKGERDPRGATIRKIVEGSGGEITAADFICQPEAA
ncbi:helix-turn-helix domain-containing protein [Methylobacterium komagatae]|uniref:Helix-turn-helix domain-containing protein n=1 Tax=Methylobacterium komagatae TaxID=374425 RepID=A0ABW2BRX9_9HYPH